MMMLSFKEMSILSSVVGAAAVMAWRVREGRSAVTIRKIVIPPLGMATGCCEHRVWCATAKPS